MSTAPHQLNRATAAWRTCLASAARTALACTIVGITTLYGPASLQRQVAFPAFSYVTAILILTDATLGDTLRSCWLALYASVQSLGPAMLSLWLIGPAKLTNETTAVAVALAGLVVVLPESTHLVAKRIALGQIVLVYAIGFINGEQTHPIMHPVHVAASTAVGVAACVLALLLPYPRLACCEAKENCKLLAENGSERVKLLFKALCAEDKAEASASISQTKLLATAGTKLLQSIKRFQGSMKWEELPFKFLRPYYMNSGKKLEEIEIALRGMEMALESSSSFPATILSLDGEIKNGLPSLEQHISLTIKQAKSLLPNDSLTVPESNADDIVKFLQTLQTIPPSHQDLPTFFFLFCMKLLHSKSLPKPFATKNPINQENGFFSFKEVWSSCGIKTQRLIPALKFSLSLGFSVLFGLMYSKPNGYWSGLPVAVSFAAAREATFKVANVKAQGTVLGTVYGVIGCFLFEKLFPVRFMSLLPWFLFTSFLRQSKMYGQAGAISAVIGAVLILGRKNFGPPSEFAIARIIETFIGLSCSIVVELVFQPTRASTLAKIQLSKSLETLHECIDSVSLHQTNLAENQKKLKIHVNQLGKFIGEAEVEPNFWFLPFRSACYGKLLGSLSKMVELLLFGAHAIGFLEQESSQKLGNSWKETVNKLDGDLKLFKESVGSLVKYLEKISLIKSLPTLDKELEKNNISHDLEMGKSPCKNLFRASGSDEDEMDKILNSFLQHSKDVVDVINGIEDEKELKSQTVLSLSALGYCMKSLIRESRNIEEGITELVQWENPSSHVNLHEILCKMRALDS